jgi:hypothetical protein
MGALGLAIQGVVDALDAVHLKPTSILQRLRDGVGAACFGVATLIQNLPEAPSPEGTAVVTKPAAAAIAIGTGTPVFRGQVSAALLVGAINQFRSQVSAALVGFVRSQGDSVKAAHVTK